MKDNYKKAEYLLYNYKMLKISIENLNKEIELIKNNDGVTGINYDTIPTSSTNVISSITENTALSNTEKVDFLEHNIKRIENKVERIERAMQGLTEVERQIVQSKYIEGKQWYIVAYKVSYSERQCRNIRRTAIEKIALGIFGDIAT